MNYGTALAEVFNTASHVGLGRHYRTEVLVSKGKMGEPADTMKEGNDPQFIIASVITLCERLLDIHNFSTEVEQLAKKRSHDAKYFSSIRMNPNDSLELHESGDIYKKGTTTLLRTLRALGLNARIDRQKNSHVWGIAVSGKIATIHTILGK